MLILIATPGHEPTGLEPMSKLMKSTRNNEWLKMYPEVPYEVGLSHLESHPEKLDKEKSTIEYDILAAALRYFPTLLAILKVSKFRKQLLDRNQKIISF